MANLLLTNDDGIQYPIFNCLCNYLEKSGHAVYVVAPADDQSWISAAISSRREIVVDKVGPTRWAVHGTPADCPAIAPHLLGGVKIDAIISGVNVGDNTHLPMVISSGTVGAATVGALVFKTHSLALSLATGPKYFMKAKKHGGLIPGMETNIEAIMALTLRRISQLLGEKKVFGRVYNVNFPVTTTMETPWVRTPLAISPIQSLFVKQENGSYKHYPLFEEPLNNKGDNERTVINRGEISEAILDWANIGETIPAAQEANLGA